MCKDHAVDRRTFLQASGALAVGALVLPAGLRKPPRPRLKPAIVDPNGYPSYSNAMHIHTSFSEYTGSMDAHLCQATLTGTDVLWFTDHDRRLDGTDYINEIHFIPDEKPPPGGGKPIQWNLHESGPSGPASGGGIVTNPCSPNDPVAAGAMSLTAQSTSTVAATYGYACGSEDYRDNLGGQSLTVNVMLNPGWSSGYLELKIATSYHPASGGLPAGTYSLSYRFTAAGQAHRSTSGRTGIVTQPVTADGQTWTTVTITPAADIAALWPSLSQFRDFALYQFTLSAVSVGQTVSGYFDYLRFSRTMDGGELFAQQGAMMESYAALYPAVTQWQGIEVSFGLPHVNWFGSNVQPFGYNGTVKDYPAWVEQQAIPDIHAAGGLCSYNHPYGPSWTKVLKPQAEQDALLTQVAGQLLPAAVYGANIMEVGYPKRAGVDMAHHVALWDILSRNAVFVTGNGTSDDHWGDDWAGLTWNWTTSTWAASTAQANLLASLAAGRVYMGSLASPPVALDLLVDGEVPMGAVSVSSLTSRSLSLTAAGLPDDGFTVAVYQGAVDYAGTAGLASNAVPVGSFGAGDLDGNGQASLGLDTSAGSYVRTELSDGNGVVQGLSNPVWLLQNTPPNGIPAPRQF